VSSSTETTESLFQFEATGGQVIHMAQLSVIAYTDQRDLSRSRKVK
jgi:hypothetical protein